MPRRVPRKTMRDVVVCIPGITGSVLRKDGRDVWNISGGALINALTTLGRSIDDLKLEQDPPDVDDLGDGITAPEVIRDVHLIPGLWKIDGYTKMLRTSRRRSTSPAVATCSSSRTTGGGTTVSRRGASSGSPPSG